MHIVRNHIVALGLFFSVLLMGIASLNYPGGSIRDIHSQGYSWSENYISNLLEYKALNGMNNGARPFAVAGAVLMGITMGAAFVRFAAKVNIWQYSPVIKYMGFLLAGFSALITIPSLHDLMVTLGSVATLLVFFYMMVLFLRTRLFVWKVLSVLFLMSLYGATYMYSAKTGLEFLPIVQKGIYIFQIIWVLGLEYKTKREDFLHAIN